MALVARVRCSFPGKDAGSARIPSDTGATEGAVLGASSAAWRHSRYFGQALLDEVVLEGECCRRGARRDAQLPEDVLDVAGDCVLAHDEFGGDRAVRSARREQAKHLELALAQAVRLGPLGAT